jgi:hypothetical protein
MKSKLPVISFVLGMAVWLISLYMIYDLNTHHYIESPDPKRIFKPGAFESLLIILFGASITGIGLLTSIIALKISGKRKLSWAAIIINGLYCIPIAALLILSALRK